MKYLNCKSCGKLTTDAKCENCKRRDGEITGPKKGNPNPKNYLGYSFLRKVAW